MLIFHKAIIIYKVIIYTVIINIITFYCEKRQYVTFSFVNGLHVINQLCLNSFPY